MHNTMRLCKYIILLAFSISLNAQLSVEHKDTLFQWTFPDNTFKAWTWTGSNMYLSGFFDGFGEVLTAKYDHFERVFPNADPSFWDRNRSQHRKWKNGDPAQGEAFFLSSTALVWTRDGYHGSRFLRNRFMVVGLAIPIGQDRKEWYWYLLDTLVYSAAYSFGFHTSYTLILNAWK